MKDALNNRFDMSGYEAVGIYSWRVQTNQVFGAFGLWQIFDLADIGKDNGLPIEYMLDRLHFDDKARVAKAMYDAIVTGMPYAEQYRVVTRDGSVRVVRSIGQCFRGEDDQPEIYSGTIFLKQGERRHLFPSLEQTNRITMLRQ